MFLSMVKSTMTEALEALEAPGMLPNGIWYNQS